MPVSLWFLNPQILLSLQVQIMRHVRIDHGLQHICVMLSKRLDPFLHFCIDVKVWRFVLLLCQCFDLTGPIAMAEYLLSSPLHTSRVAHTLQPRPHGSSRPLFW